MWGGGNGEFEVYVDDSNATLFLRDGKMVIRPILTSEYIDSNTGKPVGESNVLGCGRTEPRQVRCHLSMHLDRRESLATVLKRPTAISSKT